jgi:hypothetical protein
MKTNFKSQLPEIIKSRCVVNENECWVWQGATKDGYGYIRSHRKLRRTHRVMYEALQEIIPEGMELDHLCRNHSCCNPMHLEVVSHKENVRRGISAKLTVSQVTEIRRRVVACGLTKGYYKRFYRRLAREYNVTSALIGYIVREDAWII